MDKKSIISIEIDRKLALSILAVGVIAVTAFMAYQKVTTPQPDYWYPTAPILDPNPYKPVEPALPIAEKPLKSQFSDEAPSKLEDLYLNVSPTTVYVGDPIVITSQTAPQYPYQNIPSVPIFIDGKATGTTDGTGYMKYIPEKSGIITISASDYGYKNYSVNVEVKDH